MAASPSQQEQERALKRCLAAKSLQSGGHYTALLRYLVEATAQGRRPKASDIAIDVFGKDPSVKDYDEAVIRVYVRNLRQKLDSYYGDEGRRDKVRLAVPKGAYSVAFTRISWRTRLNWQRLHRALLGLTVLCMAVGGFMLGRHFGRPQSEEPVPSVWQGVVGSDLPVLMVMGNPFVYVAHDTALGRPLWIRDFGVQSQKDFDRFKAAQPRRDLKPSEWPYFTDNVIFGLVEFLPFFERMHQTFSVEERTDLSLEDLERQHMLFVGGQHTLGFFKELLAQPPVSIGFEGGLTLYPQATRPDTLHFVAEDRLRATSFEDVCLIVKMPGPRENVLIFVTSYHGTGTRAGARLMTDPAGLQCLEADLIQRLGTTPPFFIAVFKVLGLGDLDYRAELLHAEAVDGSLPLWTAIPAASR